ncbi:hypothetical protein JTE90_011812 [Oedothorax gibbosus]|uniref:Uncharacterized protein n=1 Tax=Oedothorax gibbosus TaxID=931172 RepID=A0AAV6VR64_9ARAC|nr:hypothetical protein JTE90_011812 [Oedothorax gibbosus]
MNNLGEGKTKQQKYKQNVQPECEHCTTAQVGASTQANHTSLYKLRFLEVVSQDKYLRKCDNHKIVVFLRSSQSKNKFYG